MSENGSPSTQVTPSDGAPSGLEAGELAQVAVRLLRGFPRPIQQAQLAGFLSTCRAHPLATAALDYAVRKQEQTGRSEQRLEHEFWGQVRQCLLDLQAGPSAGGEVTDQAAGRLATALARHLVAENLLRLALAEGGPRPAAPRAGPAPRPRPAPRTGGERD